MLDCEEPLINSMLLTVLFLLTEASAVNVAITLLSRMSALITLSSVVDAEELALSLLASDEDAALAEEADSLFSVEAASIVKAPSASEAD